MFNQITSKKVLKQLISQGHFLCDLVYIDQLNMYDQDKLVKFIAAIVIVISAKILQYYLEVLQIVNELEL